MCIRDRWKIESILKNIRESGLAEPSRIEYNKERFDAISRLNQEADSLIKELQKSDILREIDDMRVELAQNEKALKEVLKLAEDQETRLEEAQLLKQKQSMIRAYLDKIEHDRFKVLDMFEKTCKLENNLVQDNERVLRELGWKSQIGNEEGGEDQKVEENETEDRLQNIDLEKLLKPTVEDYDKEFMERLRLRDPELYFKIIEMETTPEAEVEDEPFVPIKPTRRVDPSLYEPPEDYDEEEKDNEDDHNDNWQEDESNPQEEMQHQVIIDTSPRFHYGQYSLFFVITPQFFISLFVHTQFLLSSAIFVEISRLQQNGRGHQRDHASICLLYTSPSPRDGLLSRMPSSA
eukprot:TRINITY_DN5823_c0_g1_i2.p1 TRINITY_DN5823_c0_g1~~TRINITY_DN5823_c0_g1_i2.p1  ORF type:complete len:349 (-),score=60.97 TRINITY_DN5823_c0_g1_i2:11-1057(-)